jgi:hypothetical protein
MSYNSPLANAGSRDAIWRKSAVDWRFGGELRAAGSPLRFVSMRDLQVKRLKSEDPWQQS